MAVAQNPKAANQLWERLSKIHGPYIAGFYDSELASLEMHLTKGK